MCPSTAGASSSVTRSWLPPFWTDSCTRATSSRSTDPVTASKTSWRHVVVHSSRNLSMTAEPSRQPSHTASASSTCLVCGAALSPRQQRYCTRACQQHAYRARHQQPDPLDLPRLRAELQRQRRLLEHTVYECPICQI